ncbi:thaumatin-like protein 1 [Zingiber officinale]|uniref:thaumatin-like protein 1 n=1 Tax=Zingiber officinale TaxID=94328 RepID=UPI001C4D6475|nr:thaumatin-like protein 1 [Zingiber officinale]
MTSSATTALILHFTLLSLAHAATFQILNLCTYTIWPGAIPAGGRRLDPGQVWTINVAPGTTGGQIWARTGCSFNSTGIGRCLTGDCAGLLECEARELGSLPVTLVEFSLDQFENLDFFDISLVDGFNVPVNLIPTSGGCPAVRCEADITASCPEELRAPGGCNSPCTVFGTDEYCCRATNNCRPTNYSMFFKSNCPNAYSYASDDATSTFNCTSGTDYTVAFCASSGGDLATRFGRMSVRLVVPQINA